MLNRDVLANDPTSYRLANDGVAKVSFPPPPDLMEVLRGELSTFVCDGAYAAGLTKILDAFNAVAGRKGSVPAVWISGFYGSGKSHLAAMLAALWTNLRFPDGADAEGLVHDIPTNVKAGLRELAANASRSGGAVAGGDTLGYGSQDPVEAVLAIILKTAGLPTDLVAARVALWLDQQGILDVVRADLGDGFDREVRGFLLSDEFAPAVLKAKPSIAPDIDTLLNRLETSFGSKPEPTVDLLVEMGREALLIGRKEIPLTLIVLDEVQEFIRQDPALTLKIQTITEQLCTRFDGRLLVVCTGQQALTDTKDLQRLLGRFSVQIPLGSADIDSVIRRTVLRKRPETLPAIKKVLDDRSGEIHKQLAGTKLAHGPADEDAAVLDWPILPTRRRLWERVLRELDKSGLGGTLRGQLRTSLDAIKQYGDKPLGHAVPVDFLYGRFADEAFSRNLLPRETRDRIDLLRGQPGDGALKARILMVVYLLSRIAGEAAVHGVTARSETIADLLIEDLANAAEIRAKVPVLLDALQNEGAVIPVGGEWRLQTKESAEWQQDFTAQQAVHASDANGLARKRDSLLTQAIDDALAGAVQVQQGASKTPRKIQRLKGDEKASGDGVALRLWNGWDDALAAVEKDIAAAGVTDSTLHFVIPAWREAELRDALITLRAAEDVLQQRGVTQGQAGQEAKTAMETRRADAERKAREILQEAVNKGRVLLAGGAEIGVSSARSDAVKEAAFRVLDRLFPEFKAGDHTGWESVIERARKKQPDAIKAVDHTGEPQDHPVCKVFLKALAPTAKGAELRSLLVGAPYGWPVPVAEAAALVLQNAAQLKVTGEDGKAAVLADLPRQKFGLCVFRVETRIVTAKEKIAVRGLGTPLGLTIPPGEEGNYLVALVDRLAQTAAEAGANAPAPEAPVPPGMGDFRALTGNDLLVALAEKVPVLLPLIDQWKKDKAEIAARTPRWRLAESLVALGAEGERAALDAVRAGRSLLGNPNPVPPLVAAAADDLRARANAAYAAWEAAWNAGEERLKNDSAWIAIGPDKKHDLRAANGLMPQAAPDLSSPETIAASLRQRGLSEWQNMALALPARVDAALRDAAVELEPKTQSVRIPRPTLRSESDLNAWLDKLREEITPHLALGPVLPTA